MVPSKSLPSGTQLLLGTVQLSLAQCSQLFLVGLYVYLFLALSESFYIINSADHFQKQTTVVTALPVGHNALVMHNKNNQQARMEYRVQTSAGKTRTTQESLATCRNSRCIFMLSFAIKKSWTLTSLDGGAAHENSDLDI